MSRYGGFGVNISIIKIVLLSGGATSKFVDSAEHMRATYSDISVSVTAFSFTMPYFGSIQ